jgi:hypothetical protein
LERSAAADRGTAVAGARREGSRMTIARPIAFRAVVYNGMDSPPPGVTGLQWR